MNWVPETAPAGDGKTDAAFKQPAVAGADPSGPTLTMALQDKLGLKLEARKAPIEILVVDHAERVPTEN